jgi:hypothetical protein
MFYSSELYHLINFRPTTWTGLGHWMECPNGLNGVEVSKFEDGIETGCVPDENGIDCGRGEPIGRIRGMGANAGNFWELFIRLNYVKCKPPFQYSAYSCTFQPDIVGVGGALC